MLDIIRSYALKLDIPQMTIVGGKKAPLTNKSGAKIDKQATLKAGRLRKFETSAGAVGKAQKTLRSATATKEQRDRAKATIKRAVEKMRSGGSGIPFEKLHPRYPKGSPGGKGGKFMPKGSAEYKATVANNLAVEVASGKATLSEARQAAKETGITTPPKKPELGEELGAMFKEADRIGKKYQDEPEAAPAKKTKAKTKQPATDATSVTEAEAKPTGSEASAKKAKPSKAKEAAKTKPAKNDLEVEAKPTGSEALAEKAKPVKAKAETAAKTKNVATEKNKFEKGTEKGADNPFSFEFDAKNKELELKAQELNNKSVSAKNPDETKQYIKEAKQVTSQLEEREAFKFTARAKAREEYDLANPLPKSKYPKISTFDQFSNAVKDATAKLIHDNPLYSSGHIPIWEIRNEIGNASNRQDFDRYLKQMQSKGDLTLIPGDLTYRKDQQINSIDDLEYGRTLFFAKPTKFVSYIPPKPKISYDKFKEKAMEIFNDLKQKSPEGFIPIRVLREKMKNVDRSDFNYYLPKMQEDNLFHFRTGGSELTNQQKNDSLYLPNRGLAIHIGDPKK